MPVVAMGYWDILENGMQWDLVYYKDKRDGIQSLDLVVEMTASHDEDSHELRTTAPQDKVRLVTQVEDVYTTYDKVSAFLVKAMGSSKRRIISRWILASKHLPESVLQLMDLRVEQYGMHHGLKETVFFECAYLVPPDSKVKFKLEPEWQPAAVKQYVEYIDAGTN